MGQLLERLLCPPTLILKVSSIHSVIGITIITSTPLGWSAGDACKGNYALLFTFLAAHAAIELATRQTG
jgi:hypothetical protein